jgi:hypothetical protein
MRMFHGVILYVVAVKVRFESDCNRHYYFLGYPESGLFAAEFAESEGPLLSA